MQKIIIVGKVKSAGLKYTPQGKAVYNVVVNDYFQDKNETWHGASYKMAWWGEAAENMVGKVEEGKVYVFESDAIDKIETFNRNDGSVGNSVVLYFPKWRWLPRTGGSDEESALDVEGGVITETQDVGVGD